MSAPHLSAVPPADDREPVPSAGSPSGSAPPPATSIEKAPARSRATCSLPTDRIKPEKQFQVLGEYARLTDSTRGCATSEDIAQALGLTTNTAGLIHNFFIASNWVEKGKRGEYRAKDSLLAYHRQRQAGVPEEELRDLLADAARTSWYWPLLESLIGNGEITSAQARFALQREANAYNHAEQIETLLAWLQWLRLITISADVVRLVRRPAPIETYEQEGEVSDSPSTGAPQQPSAVEASPQAPAAARRPMIRMSLELDLTAEEAASLDDERFKAIMDVIAAHGR